MTRYVALYCRLSPRPDGSYEGTAANGAKTVRKITTGGGKASFQSANSAGSVAWSQEDGKDMLLFVRADGPAGRPSCSA